MGHGEHHGDRQDAGDPRGRGGSVVLAVPTTAGQFGAIALAAVVGIVLLRNGAPPAAARRWAPASVAVLRCSALRVFFTLLAGLPLLAAAFPNQALGLFNAFYRAGSLVFGGGHVVLPLLQAEVVPPGWVTNNAFLAGYGAAQAVPGTAVHLRGLSRRRDGAVAERLGRRRDLPRRDVPAVVPAGDRRAAVLASAARQAARPISIAGVNAAVVGLLLAALYHPVWTQRHHGAARFRGGACRIPPAHGVEDAAMDGRRALRRDGRGAGQL